VDGGDGGATQRRNRELTILVLSVGVVAVLLAMAVVKWRHVADSRARHRADVVNVHYRMGPPQSIYESFAQAADRQPSVVDRLNSSMKAKLAVEPPGLVTYVEKPGEDESAT